MIVRCHSPSCSAEIAIPARRLSATVLARVLRRHRWAFESQPGDEVAHAYCPRCTESTP
jgi:hypothetical protein